MRDGDDDEGVTGEVSFAAVQTEALTTYKPLLVRMKEEIQALTRLLRESLIETADKVTNDMAELFEGEMDRLEQQLEDSELHLNEVTIAEEILSKLRISFENFHSHIAKVLTNGQP
jgi:protein involved in sex pheromone biosynthesis